MEEKIVNLEKPQCTIAKEINQQVLPKWPRSGTFKIRPLVIFPR